MQYQGKKASLGSMAGIGGERESMMGEMHTEAFTSEMLNDNLDVVTDGRV